VPERSRRKRPADLNKLAASIVADATGGAPEAPVTEIQAAARALGSRGGKKGGPARAAKLTSEQRSAIAKKAAQKRWKTPKP
jgi:hypothetical protein